MYRDTASFVHFVTGIFAVLFPATCLSADEQSVNVLKSPNVVIIFMDDMGYGDIGPFGADQYATPNLDAMAAQGRVFRNFVVSSAVCSASRAALMTGCLHRRVGVSGAYGPKSEEGLHPQETTIAEVCKSVGYRTACFGKWHLGHHPKFLPTNQGFDEFYGIPYSNDMWPLHPSSVAKRKRNPSAKINWPALPMIEATPEKVKVVNEDVSPDDQRQMTAEFTRRGVEFIHACADNPFLLYMPHPMVHVPLYVNDKFEGKSGDGLFGDVMMEIDDSVGQILDAVDAIGASERTLVVFTSDNGPWLTYGDHSGSSGGLREGKGTMFEGGYREPTVMRWPSVIAAGSETNALCSTIDLLPTIASLIKAPLPAKKIDGLDISPVLLGDSVPDQIANRLFPGYYAGGQLQMIRDQRFKLVFDHRYRTLNGRAGGSDGQPAKYEMASSGEALYDLDHDIAETRDVASENPDVVARLRRAADDWRSSLGDKIHQQVGSEIRPPGKMQPDEQRLPLVWK